MKNIYKIAYSTNSNVESAITELKAGLGNNLNLIVFFTSSNHNPEQVASGFSKQFPHVTTVGCTTAGEIISGQMLDNSIVAMGFESTVIADLKAEIVENPKGNREGIKTAFKAFEEHFNVPMQLMDHTKYVGLVLTDGLSGAEEAVMDEVGNLTDVTFIGGSTGDDLKFRSTNIFYNGKSFTNASLLLLLKPRVGFSILKTQSFRSSGKKLVVTKAIESERKVIEFNHKPATAAYAEALGVTVAELDKHMFYNPLGLMAEDGQPFVRSPRVIEGTAMYFYCSIMEGMELDVLNSTDIVNDTFKALADKKKEVGEILLKKKIASLFEKEAIRFKQRY